jgi:hypothetical protein
MGNIGRWMIQVIDRKEYQTFNATIRCTIVKTGLGYHFKFVTSHISSQIIFSCRMKKYVWIMKDAIAAVVIMTCVGDEVRGWLQTEGKR